MPRYTRCPVIPQPQEGSPTFLMLLSSLKEKQCCLTVDRCVKNSLILCPCSFIGIASFLVKIQVRFQGQNYFLHFPELRWGGCWFEQLIKMGQDGGTLCPLRLEVQR